MAANPDVLPEGVEWGALAHNVSYADILTRPEKQTVDLALRVLKIVAQPSDEQKEAVADAFWGKSDDGKYRLQHGHRVLAAILDMAKQR